MTLLEVIRSIEIAARRQPAVRMVVQNDIFRLNTIADAFDRICGVQGVLSIQPFNIAGDRAQTVE